MFLNRKFLRQLSEKPNTMVTYLLFFQLGIFVQFWQPHFFLLQYDTETARFEAVSPVLLDPTSEKSAGTLSKCPKKNVLRLTENGFVFEDEKYQVTENFYWQQAISLLWGFNDLSLGIGLYPLSGTIGGSIKCVASRIWTKLRLGPTPSLGTLGYNWP